MSECINIPIQLIQDYSKTRDSLETLAFSVWIKINTSNGIYHYPSCNMMRSELGISKKKAESLIERAKESELFDVNEKKGVIFAKSFKSNQDKTSRNGKWHFTSDRCYKMRTKIQTVDNDGVVSDRDYKLREIVEELRKALIGQSIKDKQQAVSNVDSNPISAVTFVGIKYSELKKKLNVSTSSIKRVIDKLIKCGQVAKDSVIEHLFNDDMVSEFKNMFPHAHIAKARHGYIGLNICSYSFEGDYSRRFQHVMYNHHKRIQYQEIKNSVYHFGGTLSYLD